MRTRLFSGFKPSGKYIFPGYLKKAKKPSPKSTPAFRFWTFIFVQFSKSKILLTFLKKGEALKTGCEHYALKLDFFKKKCYAKIFTLFRENQTKNCPTKFRHFFCFKIFLT